MVTIEEKISLFSKILQQEMKNHVADQMISMDKEFEAKKYAHHEKIEQQKKEILAKAKKKASNKEIEIESRGKVWAQKQTMSAKNALFKKVLNRLDEKVISFTKSEAYKEYLLKQVKEWAQSVGEDPIVVKMTEEDIKNCGAFIKEECIKKGLKENQILFKVGSSKLLGGMIIEMPNDTRIDLSIASRVLDSKEMIIGEITKALGKISSEKAGETID